MDVYYNKTDLGGESMGLQKCGLNLNDSRKELQPHGTLDFPCAGYSDRYTDRTEYVIPWHWHEELEIIYVKAGTLKVQIPAKSFFLRTGNCIIINSGILHYAAANPACEINSLVFSPGLVTGNDDSVFAKKYVGPLISCTSFNEYLLKPEENKDIIDNFVNAFEALSNNAPGYEFIVRENLSAICFFLYQQYNPELAPENTGLNQDTLRIQKMLAYIHSRFSEHLTLSDIAKAADIGERECLRCFQRTIQISPMQYLLKYRIMQGAGFLIKNPADSISEIAALCGFDSPSHFSKIFRRFYNCTPKEYRDRFFTQKNQSVFSK